MARAAAAAGEVSFPLDMYRYWETSKRANDQSRNDVVDVMLELSKGHSMALPNCVLDEEIDRALLRRFGRPAIPRTQQVFGVGIRHIGDGRIDWPDLDLDALKDHGVTLSPGVQAQLRETTNNLIEEQLLRTGPTNLRTHGFDPSSADHGERFVDWENSVAEKIRERGYKGDQVDMAMRASDLSDILPAVRTALERIDLAWEDFYAQLGDVGIFSFMDDLPSRHVTSVMRAAKHRQSEQPWVPNDFIDIVALPVASVYCDVVITEKQWAHRLRQGKVHQRYNTRILCNTADLVGILVDQSAQ